MRNLVLFYKIQESGFTEIVPSICTLAIWGQCPAVSHPESPQIHLWGWLQQLTGIGLGNEQPPVSILSSLGAHCLGGYSEVMSSVVSDSLWPHGLYSPWNSLGQNTGVGSLSLLQGIFPTQGSNPGLLHCRQILYQLSHKGSPRILEWVAHPFSIRFSRPRNWTGVSCSRWILYQLSHEGSLYYGGYTVT